MPYIIIVIVVLGLIGVLFQWIADGGWKILLVIGLPVVAYFATGWMGVLAIVVMEIAIGLIGSAAGWFKRTTEEHDERKKEIAQINQVTQANKEAYENEQSLFEVLDKDCRNLGYMNRTLWKEKLQNYEQKNYSTDFYEIVENFAKQIEEQKITYSDDWFKSYWGYVVSHPMGSTIPKMLEEVPVPPQLLATHITRDDILLKNKLDQLSEARGKDRPALFSKQIETSDAGTLYKPTRYGEREWKRMSGEDVSLLETPQAEAQEIDFDDL